MDNDLLIGISAPPRHGCFPLPGIGMSPMPLMLPWSMPGVVAPAFSTITVAVTCPALANLSVTGSRRLA